MAIKAIFKDYNTPGKLLITVGACLVLVTIFSTIGIVICNAALGIPQEQLAAATSVLSDPTGIAAAKILQLMMELGFFIGPPLLVAFLFNGSIRKYLLISKPKQILPILTVILIILSVQPLISFMAEWNNKLVFPGFLSELGKWMEDQEEKLAELTKTFLYMPAFSDFMINILLIALLPAIGEELLFRGVLQRLFMEWSKNVHVAVIVTAMVFSAIHMQFLGFLPRFVLGMLLGYLVVWSGSLWYSVTAHFINNASVVVLSYLFQHHYSSIDPDKLEAGGISIALVVASAVLATALVYLVRLQFKSALSESIYDYQHQ